MPITPEIMNALDVLGNVGVLMIGITVLKLEIRTRVIEKELNKKEDVNNG